MSRTRFFLKAPNDSSERVFFGRDESLQQSFVERTGKKLEAIISERFPGHAARFTPSTGIVSVDWLQACGVVAPRAGDAQI